MSCGLLKQVSHEDARSKVYAETMLYCAVAQKHICLWCCLHISDMARTLTKDRSIEANPELYNELSKAIGTTWEQASATCNGCLGS